MRTFPAPPASTTRWTSPSVVLLALFFAHCVKVHAAPLLSQRAAAAQSAAESPTNACAAVRPFYWEIGDARGILDSGSVQVAGDRGMPTYTARTVMPIASASKWLFAAYLVQREHGRLTSKQIGMLNFTSGYIRFHGCRRWQTVDQCLDESGSSILDESEVGKFYYSGGHMEELAEQVGLGHAGNATLTEALRGELGKDIRFFYVRPQPAGGMVMDAANYARFLRRMMDRRLLLGRMLDADAVCTDPGICPSRSTHSPIPQGMGWYYGLGHWIEGTPGNPDAAYSSAGAFGFYPWISQDLHWYGIVARREFKAHAGIASAECGVQIRAAWIRGQAPVATSTIP